ncbi:serine/threonine protein kinase [Roseiconus lacunae]|uniref:Serine/threonine protein kinase n=1 Tax=Roseiconus lacunae TaxID=2605694 RepID=A0ABT7PMG3_9BACT|nr:serine/threonine protein kinase [Roseiconus lacunae]MDM4017665.1 serine/threonine protein kinase [Roseiconus lacunae]
MTEPDPIAPHKIRTHQQSLSASWRDGSVWTSNRTSLGSSLLDRSYPGLALRTLLAFALVCMIAALACVNALSRQAIREGIGHSLEDTLRSNGAVIDLWLRQQIAIAVQMASGPSVRQAVSDSFETIPQLDAPAPDTVQGLPAATMSSSTATVGRRLLSEWAILNEDGQVVFATEPNFVGESIAISRHCRKLLNDGHPTVLMSPSARSSNRTSSDQTDTNAASHTESFVMPLVPIRDGLRTIGAVVCFIDADEEFSQLFRHSSFGGGGEAYAFDRRGTLLTESRYEPWLRTAGLLSEDERSSMHIQLRDPGFDLRDRRSPDSSPTRWPLTRMADSATRGGYGQDLDGYRNYLGRPVVGAWHWLDNYDIGLAAEVSWERTFSPMRWVDRLTWGGAILASLGIMAIFAGPSLIGLIRINKNSPRVLDRHLGPYELTQRIGRGGMGTVYLGTHRLLDRPVAIKVLENADATERSLTRFRREVRLSANLMHPNTIEIYDIGATDEGTFYYVMEYVDGISLEQLVDFYDRQPADRVIYLLVQICGSISEAHEAGLVHRDIKPANVLLTSRSGIHDLIKVVDFGLAKQLDQESVQLTRTDSLTGTPMYMSPESIRDAASAGVWSDIYSIGAVGYTLLCGTPPFVGDSADVCVRKLHESPERPDARIGSPLPEDLQQVLLRCLRQDPKDRPQSAKELASLLLACADSPHWTQADAGIWWREIFDGPYLEDFEAILESAGEGDTRGDTAVNELRSPQTAPGDTTAS